MKTRHLLLLAAAVIVSGVALTSAQSAPAARPAATWEYGQIDESSIGATSFVNWREPGKQIAADSYEQLAEKLKAENGTPLAIYNALGKEGWEFVSSQSSAHGHANIKSHLFKRCR